MARRPTTTQLPGAIGVGNMGGLVQIEQGVTAIGGKIIPNATPRNSGVMTAEQAALLAALSGGTTVSSFERVIAQPADGSSFVVVMPTPRASTNYRVVATLADASIDVIVKVPNAGRTTTQFMCETSFDLEDGDSINFVVVEGG